MTARRAERSDERARTAVEWQPAEQIELRRSSDSGWVTACRAESSEGARTSVEWQPAEQKDQKELGQRSSDSPQSRESRRSSDRGWVTARRAERSAERARTAVEWQPAEQKDQKKLGQRLRDRPQSRERRRSSDSGWVTARRADERIAVEVRPTVASSRADRQGPSWFKYLPVLSCSQWL
jgi:hypothetical protein